MSLVSENDKRLKDLIRHLQPEIDRLLKEQGLWPLGQPPKAVVDTSATVPQTSGPPRGEEMHPSLVTSAAQHQNQFYEMRREIHMACIDGDFEKGQGHADYVWEAFPELRPFVDGEMPSKMIKKMIDDTEHYTWKKYAEVDDFMMGPDWRRYLTEGKYSQTKDYRERAITREYLYNFIGRASEGARTLGWSNPVDARFDTTDVEDDDDAQGDEMG